jgi:glyoxylase-like metal-dependent hydrolase (beta-lactamase superfamily II)
MIQVGDFEITRIEEAILHEATALFSQWDDAVLAEHRELLVPHFFDASANAFNVSFHSYLLRRPGQTILIDTCAGNDKPRPASPRFDRLHTPFLERLAAAGVTPEQVDTVICTHLHVDHIGWNTRLSRGAWVPTFPKARYVFSRVEVAARDPEQGAAAKPSETHLPFIDSVRPVLLAGQATLVAGDEQITEEIDLVPVPGHAPGQFAVRLRAQGREILFAADVLHQPVQIYRPDWNSKYCEDPAVAAATRRRLLDACADRACLVLPSHFCFPYGGNVVRRGGGFDFLPAAEDLNPSL